MFENYKLEGELLKIHTYPDKVLTQKATEVEVFDDELKTLVKNMLFTMYKSPGIGLAAPQIGLSKRIFVVDVDYEREESKEGSKEYIYSNFNPMVFINPKFIKKEGDTTYQEGCLSLPGVFEDVHRFESVTVEFQDLNGDTLQLDADELLSICLQHENDHLDGVVFLDRISNLKKQFYTKKLLKQKKLQKA